MSTTAAKSQNEKIIPVASFKGVQVTGLTASEEGRIFANFPRWRHGVPFSVVEIMEDGTSRSYPDKLTNDWEIGRSIDKDTFVSVQSVVAHGQYLYIIDTKNPEMKKTITTPTLYVYDLMNNQLAKQYILADSTKPASYVNDLRVDESKGKIYFTDSNEPGLIVLDIETGENYRVLDNHPFTTADWDHIIVGGKRREGKIHSDGIALDTKNDILYFHALTGETLYGIPTSQLIENKIDEESIFQMKTPSPDGMIIDDKGNLYMGDLQNNRIVYLTPDRKEIKELVSEGDISWPDTFSIYNGYLYYSNSRAQEAGEDISEMVFTINKVALPSN